MKRTSLLIMLAVLLALLPVIPTAQAAEPPTSGICGDDLTWTLTEDGTLSITGSGAMYDYNAIERHRGGGGI